ncbi:hypothetical protein C6H66_10535 [Photorhabdus hindustanensis]|uniref:Uncharacterized protein n=1 Tax=Photorhabdus hindustanensis TaxID=2918802 RepID=A0A2S8Q2L1_9GAMM|nr:hypothetical protein C6H66_10535 [Photorhabdus hindustanensis]
MFIFQYGFKSRRKKQAHHVVNSIHFLSLLAFSLFGDHPLLFSVMSKLRVKKISALLIPTFKRYNMILKSLFIVIFNISIDDIILRLFYI